MAQEKEVVYVFLDSQNLNLSVKNDLFDRSTGQRYYEGWKIDFKRFFVYLKDKYKVDVVFLFIGKVYGQEKLYEYLREAGYQLIFKPTLDYKNASGRVIKGNVDAELVLHTMIEFPNYDKAIIIAGDGDFHCLIEYLEQKGKLKHVFIPNRYQYSSLLRPFRSYFVYVSDLRVKLEETHRK